MCYTDNCTVPNTRPPPTEEDPDAEERAMGTMMEGELEDVEKDFGGNAKPLASIPEAEASAEAEE